MNGGISNVAVVRKTFGVVVRAHRVKRGLSLEQVVADARVNAWEEIEQGKRAPDLTTVISISRVLGMPAADLITEVSRRLAEPEGLTRRLARSLDW